MSTQGNGRNPWEDKYGKQSEPQDLTHTPEDPKYGLAAISFGLGIGSLLLCTTGFIGIIFGGISILLALISRGKNKKLLPAGRRGIIFACVGIVAGYVFIGSALYSYITNPEQRTMVNQIYEQMYGTSFDEALTQLQEGVSP